MATTPSLNIDEGSEGTGDRRLVGGLHRLTALVAIAFALFHLYTAAFGNFPSLIQRSIHVGFALALAYMLYSWRGRGGDRVSPVDWLLIAGSLAGTGWIVLNFERFMSRQDLLAIDILLGAMTIGLIMEAARRVIGVTFTLLAAISLAFAYLGPHVPAPFTHRGFSGSVIINHLYTTDLGLWGTTTSVTATVVAVFIIFGSVLLRTGGAQTFMNCALLIAGRSSGGPAKVATVVSSLFGTISGSAVANVAVTGNFTIPMMIRLNYDRRFAAGVEAAASTGGQLMPPIMGAGVFIMAELLGVPYFDIMVAATIPAFLFYFGVFAAIWFGSKRLGYAGLPSSEIPDWREALALRHTVPLIAAIGVLFYFLAAGATAQRAGFMGTMTAIALFMARDLDPAGWRDRLGVVLGAMGDAGRALVMIAILAATAQILIGIIGLSGIGVRFTGILIALSAGEMAIALIIAMVVAIVLGMGMPTTGAYLVAASVLAPALIRLDIQPVAAHLFIFYFAIISAITPPVCAAVFVASGIARSDWFKTSLVATRLGLVAFIIPFMFVYSPALLMQGPAITIILTVVSASVGVLALAGGIMGQFYTRNTIFESVFFTAGALLMLKPGAYTDLIGLFVVVLLLTSQFVRARTH